MVHALAESAQMAHGLHKKKQPVIDDGSSGFVKECKKRNEQIFLIGENLKKLVSVLVLSKRKAKVTSRTGYV